jgi:hypothetical protein
MCIIAICPQRCPGDAHRKHFGKDNDPILVWQAATRTMNSTVPQTTIDEATKRDPSSAAAEYGAEFRSDLEDLFPEKPCWPVSMVCANGHRRLANINISLSPTHLVAAMIQW